MTTKARQNIIFFTLLWLACLPTLAKADQTFHDLIEQQQWQQAIAYLESHDVDLTQLYGDQGYSLLNLALHPADQNGLFASEQRELVTRMIKKNASIVNQTELTQNIPILAVMMHAYENILRTEGADAGTNYQEKLRFMVEKGASVSAVLDIPLDPNYSIIAPMPHVLAYSGFSLIAIFK